MLQVLVLIWLMCSIKTRKNKSTFWNAQEFMPLKGYLIILIVIYHSSFNLDIHSGILQIVDNYISAIAVGLLSFMSAYGVEKKWAQNPDSFYIWLLKKWGFVVLFYIIILTFKSILRIPFETGGMMWINTFLLSYVFSCISHKTLKGNAWILYSFLWIIYSIAVFMIPNPVLGWSHQSLGYIYGCVLAHHSKDLSAKQRVIISCTCILLSIGINYIYIAFGTYPDITLPMQLLRSLSTLTMIIAIVQLMWIIALNNQIMTFIGRLNLFVFFIHGGVIFYFEKIFQEQGTPYIVTVLICTITLSVMLDIIVRRIFHYH